MATLMARHHRSAHEGQSAAHRSSENLELLARDAAVTALDAPPGLVDQRQRNPIGNRRISDKGRLRYVTPLVGGLLIAMGSHPLGIVSGNRCRAHNCGAKLWAIVFLAKVNDDQ